MYCIPIFLCIPIFEHSVKSVRIRSYSGPHFLPFGLNTERYGVSRRIQSQCGKMWTRITPNTDTFHTVEFTNKNTALTLWMHEKS